MFAAVHLPQFALQAAMRHEQELWSRPVVLVDPARSSPVVLDLTDAAFQAGVRVGLTPTQALARCRDVGIRHRSLRQETIATDSLLQCAFGFSPNIEATAPGVCTLDLHGLALLADADTLQKTRWAEGLRAALALIGWRAQVGLAPTPNLARQAARWADGATVVEDPKGFVEQLPVTALEPSSDVAGILEKWGIRHVGEFLALGQAALVERLGLEALALFAAASTTSLRPLHLVRPSEQFQESFEFEQAVETCEPLLFILRRFVDQLCPRLELLGLVAAALQLHLRLESGEKLECMLRLPQPTAQADVLFRTLRTHLETLRTKAPITAVSLETAASPTPQKQLGLFDAALREPARFQETLARLTALLGPDRVGTPVLENSHQPDSFKLVPPDFDGSPPAAAAPTASAQAPWPVRRLRPGVQAWVEMEQTMLGSRPVRLRCAVAQGAFRDAHGPWRSSGRWWEPGAWQREEWEAETENGFVLRLNRGSHGWTVEGVVD
jgi:protein ImuB